VLALPCMNSATHITSPMRAPHSSPPGGGIHSHLHMPYWHVCTIFILEGGHICAYTSSNWCSAIASQTIHAADAHISLVPRMKIFGDAPCFFSYTSVRLTRHKASRLLEQRSAVRHRSGSR
jgi:hypothetical protein